jgi:teichoic acid ribitol-phosphate primase
VPKQVALRIALVRLGFLVGRLMPLRRTVVLATAHADAISGNLAAIRDELERRPNAPRIRVLAHSTATLRRNLGRAIVESWRAGFHLATAKVFIVDDYYLPMYVIRPRAGTLFLQVWHASGAFKKFGYSVVEKGFGATEEFVQRVPIHTNYDLCLVSSMRFARHYADAFHQPLSRFTSAHGIPRTDALFGDARIAALRAALRERYAIPEGRRVVLYAPTFRGASINTARSPEDLDLAALATALGNDHVVLLRRHPFVTAGATPPPAPAGFVIDVTDHPDIHELMHVSDVLVTDYSSAIYEFSLLARPIVFFAPDHAAYEAERGFYFDFRTGVPGPVFERTEEVAAYLRAGDFDLERIRRFAAESFDVADGQATRRLVDGVIEPALS